LKYRAEIDGLRALAVVPVILFHAGFELFRGGFVGVDVFFVISGYLITTVLIEDIENRRLSIVNFYERRARRIIPALFFVMLVCIPFAWMWMPSTQMTEFSQSLIAASLFFSNIFFWLKTDYFDTAAEEKPLLHTWSLSIEEQYYVFFPIFLIFAWRFGKNRVFWVIVVMAAISFLLSEWGWRKHPTANFYLAPTRAWEIFAGAIAAFVVQERGVQKNNIFALVGLSAIVFSIFFYDENTPLPSVYTLVPVFGVVLLVLYADKETLVAKLLSAKIFVGIGLISYSAYLWHQPLFAFARLRSISEPSNLLMVSLALSSLLLAYFSWKYIECPFKKTTNISRKKIASLTVIGIIVFCTIGGVGHLTNGYASYRTYLPFIIAETKYKRIGDERQTAIRAGVCHFNRRGTFPKIDDFLENWKCTDDDEGLKPTGILITGDSHSADKAVSLRQQGFDTFQIGGAGCQLSEEYVARDKVYCKNILRKAYHLARENQIKAVFLSNRFPENQLSIGYLQSIFDYWGDVGKPVYLWAPMPNFQQQRDAFLGGLSDSYPPDYGRELKFYDLLEKIDIPENFYIIRTSDMWCSDRTKHGCSSFSQDRILMADGDHLSVEGAELFGQSVIQDPNLKALFNK